MGARMPASKGAPDANHGEICDTYRALGCSVHDTWQLGFGFPDIVVGIAGVWALVEIKTEDGELSASQLRFQRDARAKVEVVRTVGDVTEHVTRVRRSLR